MKIRHALGLMKMACTPGLYRVVKDWKSCIRFHFVHSAIESGLLLALDSPKSVKNLAQELDVANIELLEALLDVGVSTGELSFRNNQYNIKGKISKSIVREGGDALGALIQANVTYYNSAYRKISRRMKGENLSDDLGRIGDLVARISKIQEPLMKNFIAEIVKGNESINILEVGCGSGVFMRTAFEANNNVTGIGIDCDQDVVRQAEENVSKWGLSDSFKVILGDIRTYEIENYGPFDCISLYNILYYFDHEEQARLLNKLHSNLSLKGKLAIIITTQSNGHDLMAANLNLVNCSLNGVSAVPNLDHVQKLLFDSGYDHVKTISLMPGGSLYFLIAH